MFALLFRHRGETGIIGTLEYRLFRAGGRYTRFYWRQRG